MTIEELVAKIAALEAQVQRLTQRVLYGAKGEGTQPAWRAAWAPPKEHRPRCGFPTEGGPCAAPVVWSRDTRKPAHGRCARHAPTTKESKP